MKIKQDSLTKVLTLSLICSGIFSLPLRAENTSGNAEQLRASIAQIEAMPSSRLNNTKIAQLKKELGALQGSNGSSPLLAPKDTSAIPYGGLAAPRNPAPTIQTVTPQNPTRSVQDIQKDITSLEAMPSSRINNAKLAQLRTEIQKAGGASMGTPVPQMSSPLDKLYGRNAIIESLKKDLTDMGSYLAKGEGKDGHFNKIDNLSSDEKLKAFEIAQDIVDKSAELLKSSRDPRENAALKNYNAKAKLYAKELHPLNFPL